MTLPRDFPAYHLVFAVLVALAVFYSARRNRPTATKEGLVFGPVPFLKAFFALMAVCLMALAIIAGHQAELAARLFLITVAIVPFLVMPPTLIVGDNAVTSRYWWGGTKQIPWSQVHSVVENEFMNEAIVTSTGAVTIKHTELHVDRRRFLLEASARSAPYLGMPVEQILRG